MPLTGRTRLFALLGQPVSRSRSPEIHNAWLTDAGIDAVYLALEVAPGADVRAIVHGAGLAGANLTTPHKATGLQVADALTPAAAAIGAVNTLFRGPDGRWWGDNTDAAGFLAALPRPSQRAVVLGTGGAARAITWALRQSGSDVCVLGRRPEGAEALAHAFDARSGPLTPDGLRAAGAVDLVVNATTAPARAAIQALPALALPPHAVWCDLNDWDVDPPHRRDWLAANRPFVPGSGMLLHQAAAAFARFTGNPPSQDAFTRVANALVPPATAG